MFCDTYTQRHKTLLSQTILLIMTHPIARCAVLSFFFMKIIVSDEMVFWKNGVVGCIVHRYLCHKHIFDIFI